ncbi:MAG: PIN domain-containing protein [Deltaproteobacteria bacterium]|nr:PIN domain-containing protein [Deltaproteobacteria bacterium]
MPNADLVLIDTSVWIAYFRETEPKLTVTLDRLLHLGQVATAAIILAELIHGAHSPAEGRKIQTRFQPLHAISSDDRHWDAAGLLAARVRRRGHTVNLTDCYIAALAKAADAAVYTLDKHFSWIAAADGCALYVP